MKKSTFVSIMVLCFYVSTLANPSSKMYWSNRDNIQCANLNGSEVQNVVTTEVNNCWGIVIDDVNKKIYWTNRETNKIIVANLDGTNIVNLVTAGLNVPNGIALDTGAGKMYWTAFGAGSSGSGKIQRANLDGTGGVEDILFGLLRPFDIALDTAGGKMYWTDLGTGDFGTSSIRRANLDGSQMEIMPIGFEWFLSPGGIALDIDDSKLYWGELSSIKRANLDGSVIEELVVGLDFTTDIALNLMGGKMYWTDISANDIKRANLDGTSIEYLVNTNPFQPTSISLYIAIEPECINPPTMDMNGDCKVDFVDFAMFAEDWLDGNGFTSLAILTSEWLNCGLDPPEACWE